MTLRTWDGLTIHHGECENVLPTFPTASVDALLTDPPSGIGFMGLTWDRDKGGRDAWIAWLRGVLSECLRVLKPGRAGFVWALPRTSHWTATACEDAGFEVRDIVTHVFGQGMPKSRSLLKPASEHWILIKAPGELRELRIEECRIGTSKQVPASNPMAPNKLYGKRPVSSATGDKQGNDPNIGRWPANFALSHSDDCGDTCAAGCPVAELDRQSGVLSSRESGYDTGPSSRQNNPTRLTTNIKSGVHFGDSGGASKFFYVAKPSKSEKSRMVTDGNAHPTVKPTRLMRHLIELITEPGELILDPFLGSGTTAVAAQEVNRRLIGIEQSADYCEIAKQRLAQGSLF